MVALRLSWLYVPSSSSGRQNCFDFDFIFWVGGRLIPRIRDRDFAGIMMRRFVLILLVKMLNVAYIVGIGMLLFVVVVFVVVVGCFFCCCCCRRRCCCFALVFKILLT